MLSQSTHIEESSNLSGLLQKYNINAECTCANPLKLFRKAPSFTSNKEGLKQPGSIPVSFSQIKIPILQSIMIKRKQSAQNEPDDTQHIHDNIIPTAYMFSSRVTATDEILGVYTLHQRI